MTVCYIPIAHKESDKENLRFMYVTPTIFTIGINSINLSEIILKIFEEVSEFNVFGYNKLLNELWGKKMIKSKSNLHITLSISKINFSSSCIKIYPILGSQKEIKKIILKIIDRVRLYER